MKKVLFQFSLWLFIKKKTTTKNQWMGNWNKTEKELKTNIHEDLGPIEMRIVRCVCCLLSQKYIYIYIEAVYIDFEYIFLYIVHEQHIEGNGTQLWCYLAARRHVEGARSYTRREGATENTHRTQLNALECVRLYLWHSSFGRFQQFGQCLDHRWLGCLLQLYTGVLGWCLVYFVYIATIDGGMKDGVSGGIEEEGKRIRGMTEIVREKDLHIHFLFKLNETTWLRSLVKNIMWHNERQHTRIHNTNTAETKRNS